MKFLSGFLLVTFVMFLSAPTVVSLIKKSTDTSLFYSLAEEEIHKDLIEFKIPEKQFFYPPFLDIKMSKKTLIISFNSAHHFNVPSEIFSPPPELI